MPITKLLYSFIENGPLTGSLFGTASYALDSVYSASLASRSNILESASSSFSTRVTNLVTDSGSFSSRAAALEIASGSFSTRITNLVSDSGSFSTRITNLVTDSSSFSTRTATLETASGSFSTRVTNLVSDSSSFSARLSSYTGSIFGTASYATKAETLVSGININAGLITASAISVTTLNVVTITSSIEYSSGSSVFGTKTTDTQKFTGSVSITGSLTVNGTVTATSSYSSLAATASYFAGVTNGTTNYVAKFTSANVLGTSSIFDNGSVGIGTTSPAQKLEVTDSSSIAYSGTGRRVGSFLATAAAVADRPGISLGYDTAGAGIIAADTQATGQPIAFWTYNGSTWGERARISKEGNVGIGVTPSAWGSSFAGFQLGGSTSIWTDKTAGLRTFFGTNYYFDGTNRRYLATGAASEYLQATDGAHVWYNVASGTAGNTISFTERMRIDSSGNVGIGMTPSNVLDITQNQNASSTIKILNNSAGTSARVDMVVSNGTAQSQLTTFGTGYSGGGIFRSNGTLVYATGAGGLTLSTDTAQPIYFATNQTERMRIDGSGNVGIGTSSPGAMLHVSTGNDVKVYLSGTSSTRISSILSNTGASTNYNGLLIASNATSYGTQSNTGLSSWYEEFGSFNISGDAWKILYQSGGGSVVERLRIDSSGQLQMTNSSASRFNALYASGFGYGPSSYMALVVGATSGNTTVCINVDPSGNTSGAFAGTGSEVMFRNSGSFITPNSANTAYNTLLTWDSSGNISFAHPIAVTGAITATGNITAYYSDDRLKTKLGKIENALEKICSLDGFYYEANDLAQSLGYKAVREVGISAQSVQSVLPEIVAPAPIDSKYLTIHYERTVPLIIEAIKELRNEIAALKK